MRWRQHGSTARAPRLPDTRLQLSPPEHSPSSAAASILSLPRALLACLRHVRLGPDVCTDADWRARPGGGDGLETEAGNTSKTHPSASREQKQLISRHHLHLISHCCCYVRRQDPPSQRMKTQYEHQQSVSASSHQAFPAAFKLPVSFALSTPSASHRLRISAEPALSRSLLFLLPSP